MPPRLRKYYRANLAFEWLIIPKKNEYPLAIDATDRDEVFVGRIRDDISCENAINFWVVSDNLRKGAALNAIQIAEYLIQR